MTTSPIRRLAATLLMLGAAWTGSVAAAESYAYEVAYKGVFTAFQEIGIGDARLDVVQTAAVVDGEPVMRARLTASSAAYPVVEEFYPFRYEFTSFHRHGDARTLAYERRKQTSRLRHDLLLVDPGAGAVRRFDIDAAASVREGGDSSMALFDTLRRAGLPDYRDKLVPHPEALVAPREALDRLALLQQLRDLPMEPGSVRELTVTDGKEIIRYRARVAGREVLETPTGERAAWKVRLDGLDGGPQEHVASQESPDAFASAGEKERLRHPPVYLWFDAGPRRVPLRLVSHHAVGTFTATLQAERTVQRAALPAQGSEPLAR